MIIMMKKVIIPAAGLGTRLLPATKEQPKEMLPILSESPNGTLCLKPFLQMVFEQLYDVGFREFCFVVGRGKRSIEDHFTVDDAFLDYLHSKNKAEYSDVLSAFYEKVRHSTIAFSNQCQPLGFANAVYQGKFFSGNDDFLIHAGDDLILSKGNHLQRLISTFNDHKADVVFFVQKVKNPQKFGVAVGEKVSNGVHHIKKVIEKPRHSPSRLAIVAVYTMTSKIYSAVEKVKPGVNNEIQLTDAIQVLVNQYDSVYALELGAGERRIEIGDPLSYRQAFLAKISST